VMLSAFSVMLSVRNVHRYQCSFSFGLFKVCILYLYTFLLYTEIKFLLIFRSLLLIQSSPLFQDFLCFTTISDHIRHVINKCEHFLHARKSCHRMNSDVRKIIYKLVVMAKLLYASSAWWGFTTSLCFKHFLHCTASQMLKLCQCTTLSVDHTQN